MLGFTKVSVASPSILHWFGPPQFARSDLRERARALWVVSWPFFVVLTAFLLVAVVIEPHTLVRRTTTIAAVGVLVTVLHMTSRAGRPVLASWLLVIGLTVIVTQRAWMTSGIHAPVPVFYFIFIVVGGALLGVRGAIATATACTFGAITLTVATAHAWSATPLGAGPSSSALVVTLLAICLALVLDIQLPLRTRRMGLDPDAVQSIVADMRSPMQVVVSRLEMLRDELDGESAKDVEEALTGVTSLRHITSTLLDVSWLGAGRMPISCTATDLSALAQGVVAASSLLPTRDIVVEARDNVICRCDPELTRRVVEHLVNSAVKATAADERVRVVVVGFPHAASIAVTDDGPVLTPDQRNRIFELYRPDRPPRDGCEDSSGLGMAFCRLAIEAQGGTLRVEDGALGGNTFTIELPC